MDVIWFFRVFFLCSSSMGHFLGGEFWNNFGVSPCCMLSLSFLPLVSVLVGLSWKFAPPEFSEENIPGVWGGLLLEPIIPGNGWTHWWIILKPLRFFFGPNHVTRNVTRPGPCYATESALAGMADATECIGCVHEEACSMLRNVFIVCTETSSFLQNAWILCTWEHARCYAMWVVE